jgi:hypothetical protein
LGAEVCVILPPRFALFGCRSLRHYAYTQDEWNQLIKDLEILRTRKIIEIAAYKKTSGIDDVVLDIKKGKLWNS